MPVLEREREWREGRRERREEQGPVIELQFKVQPDTDNLEERKLHFVIPAIKRRMNTIPCYVEER